MTQQIMQIALLVKEYDEAIQFYINSLGFTLLEDNKVSETKRWVRISPVASAGFCLLLAKAVNDEQLSRVGNQTGGRVFLFLQTNDFERDYQRYIQNGVKFVREPAIEPYGIVAVFEDLYGNLWDLIEPGQQ